MKKKQTNTEQNREQAESTPLQHLPFNLELNVNHRLGEMPDYEKHRLIAIESAFHAEALFWLLGKFSAMAWDNNTNIEKDECFQNLSFICHIGVALSSKSAESVDRMNMALTKEEVVNG
jgi:hypothetical protein